MTTASRLDPHRLPDQAVILHVEEAGSHEAARHWAADQAATNRRPLVLVATTRPSPAFGPMDHHADVGLDLADRVVRLDELTC